MVSSRGVPDRRDALPVADGGVGARLLIVAMAVSKTPIEWSMTAAIQPPNSLRDHSRIAMTIAAGSNQALARQRNKPAFRCAVGGHADAGELDVSERSIDKWCGQDDQGENIARPWWLGRFGFGRRHGRTDGWVGFSLTAQTKRKVRYRKLYRSV